MNKQVTVFLLIAMVSSCSTKYLDIQSKVVRQEIELPFPSAFYRDIAWLSDNTLAMKYFLAVPEHGMPDNLMRIYDLTTNSWTATVPIPEPDVVCQSKWEPGVFSRVADGILAVVAQCSDDLMGGPVLLLRYSIASNTLEKLSDYNKQRVGLLHFTFVSENELIQESPIGHPMNNELYKVTLDDGSVTRILPNFLRARWPTWSPKNQLVAFWGTAQYPGKEPEELYSFDQIETLVRAPWDLYVMDHDGNNPVIIYPLVDDIGGLAWSPNGDWLAFGGTVDDVEGIWLLNINSREPIRIFDQNEIFDWSPDGTKIIVGEAKEFDAMNNDIPVKAYILELPTCVFDNSCS